MAVLEINPKLSADEALAIAGKLAYTGRNQTNIEKTTIKMLIAYAESKSLEEGMIDVGSFRDWAAERKQAAGPGGAFTVPPAWSAETVARLRNMTAEESSEPSAHGPCPITGNGSRRSLANLGGGSP